MRKILLALLLTLGCAVALAQGSNDPSTDASNGSIDAAGGDPVQVITLPNGATVAKGTTSYYDGTQWNVLAYGVDGQCIVGASGVPSWASCGGGGGAPTTASYVTSVAEAGLSNEFALGSLGTGVLINTTTTGIPTILTTQTCTNQFVRSYNASATATCASVGNSDVTAGTLALSKLVNATNSSRIVGSGSSGSGTSYGEMSSSTLTFGASSVDAALTTSNDGGAVIKQGSTPGTEQTGNFNVSGVGILSKDGIATTVTTAGIVSNATASSAGTTLQYSPSLEFDSHAWNTTGLADEKDSWIIYNKPATGNPTTHQLHIESSINGGAYSTNRFVMDQTGGLNLGGSLSIGNNANGGFSLPTTQLITWNSASVMASFADGKIKMTNNGASSFTLLALGGTSSGHPSLKRESAAALSSRLADDSAYAGWVGDNSSLTSANGAIEQAGQVSELLTLSTGGLTTDTTMNIPAGSVVTGVVTRITTAITTTTNYAVGDPTTSDRFCSASSTLTLGSTQICNNFLNPATATTDARGPRQAAAAHVRITCTGSNPGAGAIRITVYYRLYTPPTS